MPEVEVSWATPVKHELCRAARLNSIMQAFAAVPLFGASMDLEFFKKRMAVIVHQLQQQLMDEATNSYHLGYFYIRLPVSVVIEICASCDTPWDTVNKKLGEKYGGTSKSIRRLIVREVLAPRDSGETATRYVKHILTGFR